MDTNSIANMTGDELIKYNHILAAKQAEYSKLKIRLTEELTPIQQAMAKKKAEIQIIVEQQKQVKTEISAIKYAIKACAEGLA